MNTRTRATLGLAALLGVGLLVAEAAPATAAPPSHARASGYYRNPHAGRDFDRDGVPDHRDRDIDGDGVLNQRDRNDYTPRAWAYGRGNDRNWRSGDHKWRGNDRDWHDHDRSRRDYDRDGVRNDHDRDVDGDGVRNGRDRNDYNRRR